MNSCESLSPLLTEATSPMFLVHATSYNRVLHPTASSVLSQRPRQCIKISNGLTYKQDWKVMLKHCGHSMKWKELAVNRTLLVMIKRRANTFFMIVQRKVLRAAEVFATTVKRWSQGKNINQKIALLIWPLPWASNF